MSNRCYSAPLLAPHFDFDGIPLLTSSSSDGNEENDGSRKNKIAVKSFIAGGITGVAQTVFSYPIEYVKTQVQLDEKGHKKLYNGSLDCIRKTLRQGGIFSFYRGMAVLVYACVPKVATRFYILESFRNIFGDTTGHLSWSTKLLSGLAAGSIEAMLTVTPVETVKVKFINDQRSARPLYHGLLHGLSRIYQTEGIKGFYQGLTATVMKEGSNQAIRFFIVESLKDVYIGCDRNKTVPMIWTGAFGAFAGALSALSNNPLDVIKTRMQGLEAARYTNTWDCAVKIWKYEGPLAFYKGVFPRMLRVSVDVSITFIVYDKLMAFFHEISKSKERF